MVCMKKVLLEETKFILIISISLMTCDCRDIFLQKKKKKKDILSGQLVLIHGRLSRALICKTCMHPSDAICNHVKEATFSSDFIFLGLHQIMLTIAHPSWCMSAWMATLTNSKKCIL